MEEIAPFKQRYRHLHLPLTESEFPCKQAETRHRGRRRRRLAISTNSIQPGTSWHCSHKLFTLASTTIFPHGTYSGIDESQVRTLLSCFIFLSISIHTISRVCHNSTLSAPINAPSRDCLVLLFVPLRLRALRYNLNLKSTASPSLPFVSLLSPTPQCHPRHYTYFSAQVPLQTLRISRVLSASASDIPLPPQRRN